MACLEVGCTLEAFQTSPVMSSASMSCKQAHDIQQDRKGILKVAIQALSVVATFCAGTHGMPWHMQQQQMQMLQQQQQQQQYSMLHASQGQYGQQQPQHMQHYGQMQASNEQSSLCKHFHLASCGCVAPWGNLPCVSKGTCKPYKACHHTSTGCT